MTLRRQSSDAKISPPELELASLEKSLHVPYEAYTRRVMQEPRSADAWGELGMFFFAHQFEHEANTCLSEAARLDPDEFRWPYLLGLNLSVADPDAAIRHWSRVAELRPSLAIVHLRLGELYLHLEQREQARQAIQRGLELDPREARGLVAMARLELEEGKSEIALQWLAQIPTELLQSRAVYELRSQIQQRLGNYEAAVEDLTRSEQLPDVPLVWRDPIAAEVLAMRHEGRARLEQAEQLMQQQQVPQAITLLEEALSYDQRDPQVYAELAKAYMRINQRVRAEAILQEARQQHPHSVEIWFQSGVLAFRSEQFADAAKYFRMALESKPTHAMAHYNLGHTLLRLGDQTGAQSSFADAVRHQPGYAEAHVNLAKLLLQKGDRKGAVEHVSIAAPLRPQDPEVQQLVRQLTGAPMRVVKEAPSP